MGAEHPRVDTDPEAARPAQPPRTSPWTRRTFVSAAVLAAAGILLQILYVLADGDLRRTTTLASVVLFALAALVHAVAVRGLTWGVAMVVTVGGLALAVEAVGTATGFPFGAYTYTGTLGLEVAGVPLLVPLAWVWMAYPAYLAGHALAGRRWGWLAGAWTLATWDLFLDPQMVDAGHWVWANPDPALPGIPGIPLTNYAGWIGTSVAMMLTIRLVERAVRPTTPGPPGRLPHDVVPAAVLAWTYLSSVLANLVFFGRPAVAAWGALLMGLTTVPYLRVAARDARTWAASRRRPRSAAP